MCIRLLFPYSRVVFLFVHTLHHFLAYLSFSYFMNLFSYHFLSTIFFVHAWLPPSLLPTLPAFIHTFLCLFHFFLHSTTLFQSSPPSCISFIHPTFLPACSLGCRPPFLPFSDSPLLYPFLSPTNLLCNSDHPQGAMHLNTIMQYTYLCVQHETYATYSTTGSDDDHSVSSSVNSGYHSIRSRFDISCYDVSCDGRCVI